MVMPVTRVAANWNLSPTEVGFAWVNRGRFHLAERALGDIVGSLPQNFLRIFRERRESHEAPLLDAGGAGFLNETFSIAFKLLRRMNLEP